MKKIYIIVVLLFSEVSGYEISDRFLGPHDVYHDKATFEIESSFNFKGCILGVNLHKIHPIHFSQYCNFAKDRQGHPLVCIEDFACCTQKSHIKKEIINQLNRARIWYVYGVASYDTLSVRLGTGIRRRKV